MIQIRSFIRDFPTNSVEVTWGEIIRAAYSEPEVRDPDTKEPDVVLENGTIVPGRVIPGRVIPAREFPDDWLNSKSHHYSETQMGELESDLGADLATYANQIAEIRAAIDVPTTLELEAALVLTKTAKNMQINEWRGAANQTSFTHAGKQIACDPLSRSDIDAVASSIALTGTFPASFPGAWKAMDNSYIVLADVAAFKAMYASMTAQGTANFARSQSLKTALAGATTIAQVNAIQWA